MGDPVRQDRGDAGGDGSPPFVAVALKASNGAYVSAQPVHGAPLHATATAVGPNETFDLEPHGDLVAAFRAASGYYVTSPSNGSGPLTTSALDVGPDELFTIEQDESQDTNLVSLLASNGRYVTNPDDGGAPLHAATLTTGTAERFEVETPAPATTSAGSPVVAVVQTAESGPGIDVRQTAPVTTGPAPSAAGGTPFTVCFAGTACTRDEGEVSRPESDARIYADETGYIPVRLHKEISGDLQAVTPSVTVRGVGENDWAQPRNDSEPLVFDGPLAADSTLLSYVKAYSGGDQLSTVTQLDGWSAPALALHGANLAARSGSPAYNFVGHSRGAVGAIMAAWFLYAYGSTAVKQTPVNIFAIDPVPGTGEWFSILTQLPPNVANYIGVYAWDMCVQPTDKPFSALAPRPNGRMVGGNDTVSLASYWWWPWNAWKYMADDAQLQDPLAPATTAQPTGYRLFAIRGRHSTVAGNATTDATYDPSKVDDEVAAVPRLVHRMARAYLTQWGVTFPTLSAVTETAMQLRTSINLDHRWFDVMGGGATRTSSLPDRPYVRRISSIYGKNPWNTYFLDDVAGDPPYTMAYPVTNERRNAGWVDWTFL